MGINYYKFCSKKFKSIFTTFYLKKIESKLCTRIWCIKNAKHKILINNKLVKALAVIKIIKKN